MDSPILSLLPIVFSGVAAASVASVFTFSSFLLLAAAADAADAVLSCWQLASPSLSALLSVYFFY